MDDKADNPGGSDASPETARMAAPIAPSGAHIEPGPGAALAPETPPSAMFSLRPGDAYPGEAYAAAVVRSEPELSGETQTGGFFPPGAGLTPAGLLVEPWQGEARPTQQPAPGPAPDLQQRIEPRLAPVQARADGDLRTPATGRGWAGYARLAAKWAIIAAIAWTAFMAGLIILYRFLDPPFSALMAQRWLSGESVERTFVPIDAIAPALVKAVLVSEDGRFCEHHGIDLDAIQTAIEKAGDGIPRGASTISMQVAKNLFLWPSKSYVRKALEVPLTLGIELVWPKRRIMELYLNIAEWGPGVYGAEAAARHHFSKSALNLSEREAALLAVALPNPITRDAGEPGAGTRRLAALIQARANRASRYQTSCVLRQTGRQSGSWQPSVRRESAP